ncbi:hypothetical protein [Cohnella herbarum]|uniref:Copper resistance protein NlpE n=1 Tax=Cohnella herbarum TaxID=2728023 RepID=A0A7Z2VL71_9BACL|nr:hypothetical protein [Cohnella herbarum]QJD85000.1 copper resistance protein NlpE [Cohnella herbarum]
MSYMRGFMKKMKSNLYVVFLSVALIMMLAACGDGNSNSQNQSDENVTDQTQNEAEIEATSGSDALQAGQTMPVETPSSQVALTQSSSEELLAGEWYGGLEKNEFRADGTGVIEHLGDLYDFTWSIDGNTLTMLTPGTYETSFKFVGDELQLTNSDGTRILTREPSSDYVDANKEISQQQATETALTRKFLGEWYFDVFIWHFNDDGTGVIDVPEFSGDPAEQKEFTFSVVEDPTGTGDVNISITLPDGRLSMYHATFGNQSGGSVTLQPTLKGGQSIMLTRSFDVRNSPITDEIIDEGVALFESLTSFSGMGEMILEEIVKKK